VSTVSGVEKVPKGEVDEETRAEEAVEEAVGVGGVLGLVEAAAALDVLLLLGGEYESCKAVCYVVAVVIEGEAEADESVGEAAPRVGCGLLERRNSNH
jgi:hypothetical protein